jgi:uncharacterized membrane protein
MVLSIENLILLVVFLIVGVILIICCVYYCTCRTPWANYRRQLINRQIARDAEAIDQEREANRAEIRETLATNEQERDDIRKKYRLR